MLLKSRVLEEIAQGRVTMAFRKWKRPTVKAGGRLCTRIGVLAIDAVERTTPAAILERHAELAGYESRRELLDELAGRAGGDLYRIEFHLDGEDPRIELRRKKVSSKGEADEIARRLARSDTASRDGAWTMRYLRLIAERPATRAADLAELLGMEKRPFKARVRRLKELGLTESLDVGYRLSPRGRSFLSRSDSASR